jgi:hypothetical protein
MLAVQGSLAHHWEGLRAIQWVTTLHVNSAATATAETCCMQTECMQVCPRSHADNKRHSPSSPQLHLLPFTSLIGPGAGGNTRYWLPGSAKSVLKDQRTVGVSTQCSCWPSASLPPTLPPVLPLDPAPSLHCKALLQSPVATQKEASPATMAGFFSNGPGAGALGSELPSGPI